MLCVGRFFLTLKTFCLYIMIFNWIFYLFTFQMLFPFLIFTPQEPLIPPPLLLLWGCAPTHPPTPTSPPSHSPTLGRGAFLGPRASSPIDAGPGHPLLHIWLEPWVPPCVLFGWWFRPWKTRLVDIVVLPMGLQTSSAPSVLSLTPPLGALWSVQWLAVSICLCTSNYIFLSLVG
jgi:hypothetical protein